ncbi:hypothetical protein ABVK25_008950 [Lepraria finkii]|uniref:BTB domain-containing protein n=1 Tax=Lepraria finkii TaxID=1340010 RepID=A0ABR4AYH7_9LECA
MPSAPDSADVHVHKKRKIHADSFDTIVQIIVGPQKKVFSLHHQILCDVSTYFEAAFNKIEMPDEDIEMFKSFQIGLYTKEIPLADKAGKEINSDIFVDLHILEEARGIPDLQSAAIDAFITQLL